MTTETQIKACEYVREQIQKGENVGIGICYYLIEYFDFDRECFFKLFLRQYAVIHGFIKDIKKPYWFETNKKGDAQRIQLLTDYINHLKQQQQ